MPRHEPHPIGDGFRAAGLQKKLDQLERRKSALEADIACAPASAPRLHPNLAEVYRRKVANLQDALANPSPQTKALLRGLIERAEVQAAENGFAIEIVGEIANMVRLCAGTQSLSSEPYRSSVKVVAGTRNRRDPGIIRVEV